MREWLRLVRVPNLALAVAGVLAGGWIALGAVAWERSLWLAAGSGAALGASGNALNDLHDIVADRLNRGATRPLVSGRLSRGAAEGTVFGGALFGLGAAALVSGTQVLVAVAALAVMMAYSPLLKRLGVPGNIAVAVVAGLPLFYGAVAVGRAPAGIVPWVLAAWLHAVREVVKDLEDATGDRAAGRRTLPLRIGAARTAQVAAGLALAFIPISLVLPAIAAYRWPYFALAALAQLIVLAVAWRLRNQATTGASLALKTAMAIGLAALVAGRVA